MPKEMMPNQITPAPHPTLSCCESWSLVYFLWDGARAEGSTAIVPGGPGAEVTQIFKTLTAALPDYGLTLADMVKCNIFTTDMGRMQDISEAWNGIFGPDDSLPARTTVGVAQLPLGATIEIEFSFYKD